MRTVYFQELSEFLGIAHNRGFLLTFNRDNCVLRILLLFIIAIRLVDLLVDLSLYLIKLIFGELLLEVLGALNVQVRQKVVDVNHHAMATFCDAVHANDWCLPLLPIQLEVF